MPDATSSASTKISGRERGDERCWRGTWVALRRALEHPRLSPLDEGSVTEIDVLIQLHPRRAHAQPGADEVSEARVARSASEAK